MDLRKEQFVFVLTLNKNVSVKRLDDICKDFLFKRCNVKYFIERPADFKISIYCLTDEFLTKACYKMIYFCKCPNWEYKSEIVNFCNWCLFYKDMWTYSGEFIELTEKVKIVDAFYLFFRIINYWISINK